MGILDDIATEHQNYSRTTGGSRLDQILTDLDALPKTKEFPQENLDRLIAMLEGPVIDWGHKQLAGIIRQLCAALDVDDRNLNKENIGDWRAKRWAILKGER